MSAVGAPNGGRPSPAVARRAAIDRFIPAFMLVTESVRLRSRELSVVVDQAISGGVNMVQLRDKHAKREVFAETATKLRIVTWAPPAPARALLLINGDDTIAVECAADVHMPETVGSSDTLRDEWYQSLIISRSVHSIEAALQAERGGADMLVLGTVFPSTSHPGGATIGVEGVRAVCDSVRIPVIAIGGITARNAAGVMRAGASGVAVISAIFDALDPRAAAAELRAAIDEAWKER